MKRNRSEMTGYVRRGNEMEGIRGDRRSSDKSRNDMKWNIEELS